MKLLVLLSISSAVFASQCGVHWDSAPNRFERSIIGGRYIDALGKWPWQVKIENENGFCGGTVISEQWILTAAHCIKNNSLPRRILSLVYASRNGTHLTQRPEPLPSATRAIIHPEYDASANISTRDIALIKLERPLYFNHLVSPICLPTNSQPIPSDGRAVAIGFGQSNNPSTNELEYKNMLQEVMIPIVDPQDCENRWTVPGEHTVEEWTTANLICSSSLTHGIHRGDSGGPLMMKSSDGRWFEIGIAAFIHDHGTRGDLFPHAFTDVRPYCDWIKQTTNGEAKCQEEEVLLEDVGIQA